MVIRFKESVRVRVWGRELSNFRKGEIHAVPTAVAGVLLAQGCAEPVSDDDDSRASPAAELGFERFQSPIEVGDGLFQHRAVRWRARVLEIAQCSRPSEHQCRPLGTFPDFVSGHGRVFGRRSSAASCCASTALLSQPRAIVPSRSLLTVPSVTGRCSRYLA